MKPFIDLQGASGTAYRFRLIEGFCPPAAGNFVYVRGHGAVSVICCGKARTLDPARIQQVWAQDELAMPGDTLYVRLNVAVKIRDSEHEDLVAGLPRPFAILEPQ